MANIRERRERQQMRSSYFENVYENSHRKNETIS